MKLTLTKIRDKQPCESGWSNLLESLNKTQADETEVTIEHLLKSNGVSDTLWVIYKCTEGELDKKKEMIHEIAKLAIEPAESVLHIFEEKYPNDDRPRKAIEAAKKYFNEPSEENAGAAGAAGAAAGVAAGAAADAAAGAAAWAAAAAAERAAADAAAWAVWAAAWAARATGVDPEKAEREMIEKQKQIIIKYFGNN